MSSFKIAFWIDNSYNPTSGGGYSYLHQLISGLVNAEFDEQTEICFTGFNIDNVEVPSKINLPYSESYLTQKKSNLIYRFFKVVPIRKDILKNQTIAETILKDNGVDLIFYLTPDVFLSNYPYVVVNWDLGHKTTYPFPEISMFGNYESREEKIRNNLNKAIIICCESNQGKKEVIDNYKIPDNRIAILPLFPSQLVREDVIATAPQFIGNNAFFFYPAQFWAHKNHVTLLEAFGKIVKTSGFEKIKLILPGSNQGNLSHIEEIIKELQLGENVLIPGFITDQELKWLYQNAIALVFPSLLGPTNMPLIEAVYLNCKIACTDLIGHRELLNNEASFFDPLDPDDIKNVLIQLASSIENKIDYGNHPIKQTNNIEEAMKSLIAVIKKAKSIRRLWELN
jgi:glycosyltransferase involved in cell wall biosynthesis